MASPLLHWIVQEKRFPSGSLIGMLHVRLNRFPVEPFAGEGVPKTGGRFAFVAKRYHLLVYKPLPAGSVAFTQTLYVVKYARPESESDFVPFVAPDPPLVCPLLHWIVHEKRVPSGSLIGMLQEKLTGLPVEPFAGEGVPKTGGRFAFIVNVYQLLV